MAMAVHAGAQVVVAMSGMVRRGEGGGSLGRRSGHGALAAADQAIDAGSEGEHGEDQRSQRRAKPAPPCAGPHHGACIAAQSRAWNGCLSWLPLVREAAPVGPQKVDGHAPQTSLHRRARHLDPAFAGTSGEVELASAVISLRGAVQSAFAGSIVTLSPQPQASVSFGFLNTNLDESLLTS